MDTDDWKAQADYSSQVSHRYSMKRELWKPILNLPGAVLIFFLGIIFTMLTGQGGLPWRIDFQAGEGLVVGIGLPGAGGGKAESLPVAAHPESAPKGDDDLERARKIRRDVEALLRRLEQEEQ